MHKSVFVEALNCQVVIARRKGTSTIRATIKDNATVKLTIPYGVSEEAALRFLVSKKDWVQDKIKPKITLHEGNHIGKSHRLSFVTGQSIRTSVRNQQIIVHYPLGANPADESVQKSAVKGAERALLLEAHSLLPQRLKTLAAQHNFTYTSCNAKKLKSRWGSCDHNKNIVLNIYLMQLPWPLIDYVILHELTHTIHHHHQPQFWEDLTRVCPNVTQLKKMLKSYPTTVQPTPY